MSVIAGFIFQTLRSSLLSNLLAWRYVSTIPVSLSCHMSGKTIVPFSESDVRVLLFTYGRNDNLGLGACIHASFIKNPPLIDIRNEVISRNALVMYNCLLHLYCKNAELCSAVKIFDDMPLKDTVSWNTLISGFMKLRNLESGFLYFKSLLNSRIYCFDQASLTSILSACHGAELCGIVALIHALVISNGYEKEITVGNALTTSYFRCLSFDSGMHVFNEMVEKNVITWTAVISGLAQNEFFSESLTLFAKMNHSTVSPNHLSYLSALSACSGMQVVMEGAQIHGVVFKLGIASDLCIESALMDMYSKCGHMNDAWSIFEAAVAFDEVSLTVMLAGLAQNGFEEEAMQMFVKLVNAGTKLDPNMISAVLGVFGIETSRGLGVQVHSLVMKKGFTCNVFISNGLINMYSKCGEVEESVKVFDSMPEKNQVSWNSMIGAFARHGDGLKALQFYKGMCLKGVEPTNVTFLSLLQACSHVGLVHRGLEVFESMRKSYEMEPRSDHYACIIDILGRAGLVKEAKKFIDGLQVNPDLLIWQALLGACSINGDIETGKYAADKLSEVAPDSPVPYVSMANIYSLRGRWTERAKTIKKMKETGVAKEMGMSWIEIGKQIHNFVVADRMSEDVCSLLAILSCNMKDEGICVSTDVDT